MSDSDRTLAWVIGSGGLLGSAVGRALGTRGIRRAASPRIPWSDPDAARAVLREGIRDLLDQAGGGEWAILWCAGAGITSTARSVLDAEVTTFTAFADDLLAEALRCDAGGGAMFLASSAGGAYAGSSGPPFDESTPPHALSPYGEAKLAMERVVTAPRFAEAVRVVIGRIANIYGPGQNLDKPQGLISHLCRADLSGEPMQLFAPGGTLRDYLYVDDCADMIVGALAGPDALIAEGRAAVKVLCSGESVSIDDLLRIYEREFGRPVPVERIDPPAAGQIVDLRLTSVVGRALQSRVRTPLSTGMRAVMAALAETGSAAR